MCFICSFNLSPYLIHIPNLLGQSILKVMSAHYIWFFNLRPKSTLKSINKRQPAFYNKIIQVSGVLFHGWYTPSTPVFEVIHPPCNAIFKLQSTCSTKSKENKHSNINKYSFNKNKYHLKRTIQLKTAMAYEWGSCDPFRPMRVIQILISHVTLQGKQILTNGKWCNFIHPFLPVWCNIMTSQS